MTTIIRSKLAKLLFAIIFIAVMLPSIALAQVAGKLTKVSGRVDILRAGTTAATAAVLNEDVSIGDIVRTKSDGSAEITFIDNSVMTLGPRSRLGIEEYLFNGEENKRVASLKLLRGRAGFTVPKPVFAAAGSKFEMQTKTAVSGVRGTKGLLLTGAIERVYVEEGVVEFRNPLGMVTVTAGNVGEVFYGGVPLVRPFSGSEFKKQQENLTPGKPSGKQGAEGKAEVTGEATPLAPVQATGNQLTATPQQVITPTIIPPLTVIEATGTITQPKSTTTPVTINPNFPGTTINVR